MAVNTDPRLQNQIIYSIYVRNHTPEGTFRAVIGDLDRIRALGTNIIWLMPIHPIGVQGKKGTLGCPYANRDYRSVNPEYGTMEDFQELVRQIHARGMKCMIDVVYNHTSPDSVLYAEHPEYFYHNKEGKPGNKVGDWADVIDLDYTNRELWQYLTDTLVMPPLCRWSSGSRRAGRSPRSTRTASGWRRRCTRATDAWRAGWAFIPRWTLTNSPRSIWNMNTMCVRRSTNICRAGSS